jgi:transposase InsO family protein
MSGVGPSNCFDRIKKRKNREFIAHIRLEPHALEREFGKDYKSYCDVQLNGRPVRALVDSGNVVKNAISEEFACQVWGKAWEKDVVQAVGYEDVGTAKAGTSLQVRGVSKRPIPLLLGSHRKVLWTRPLVIRNLSMKMNICGPFLHANGIDQLHSKKALRMDGESIPLVGKETVRRVTPPLERPLTTRRRRYPEPILRPRGVYLTQNLEVGPRTSVTLSVKVNPWERGKRGEGLVLSTNLKEEGWKPSLATLVRPSGSGQTWMPFLNLTRKTCHLKKGTRVGTYHPKGEGEVLASILDKGEPNPRPPAVLPQISADIPIRAKQGLGRLLRDFQDVFVPHPSPEVAPKLPVIEEGPPIRCKGKPLNPVLQENLHGQLMEWKAADLIEPSSSPWSFGLIPVALKNGTLHWAADFRRLNPLIVPPPMRIPDIKTGLRTLRRGKWYSRLVGPEPWNTFPMEEEDRVKTTFQTPEGSYRFTRIPEGLRGAHATRAAILERALEGLEPGISLLYLGESFLVTETWEEHLHWLEESLRAYRQCGLTLNPERCRILDRYIDYAGYRIGPQGTQVQPEAIQVITQWPIPQGLEEWRNFEKLVQYYHKVIPDFTLRTAFLKKLTKVGGDQPGVLPTAEEEEAFLQLRRCLTRGTVMTVPDFQAPEPLILDTDWSNAPGGIGGVLSQVQGGVERVIAYGARKLTKDEANFSSNRGELAAVLHFTELWEHYLLVRPFVLRIDHQALTYLRTMTEPKGLTLPWLRLLGKFTFTIQFRAGTKHGNADALSRASHIPEPNHLQELGPGECIASLGRVIRPTPLSSQTVRELQEEDADLKKIRTWVAAGYKPTRAEIRQESMELRQYVSILELLRLDETGVLQRTPQVGEFFQQDRLCLPPALQHETVRVCHEMTGGHLGINITQQRMLSRFYFPGIHKYIEGYIGRCLPCQRKRSKQPDQRHTLASTVDGHPFRRLSIDFVGPMKPSGQGNIFLFTIKDTFTKWVEAIPCIDTTAENVARMLEQHIFCRFGIPEQIHSDQGPQFTSKLLKDVCRILNIPKTETPAYNPKSNPVERSHRDLTSIIKAVTLDTEQDWEEVLPMALLALRTARNRSTGVTPFFAMYGREAQVPVDLIYENPGEKKQHRTIYGQQLENRMQRIYKFIRHNLQLAVERARGQYGGKIQGEPLQVGELVWLFTPRVKQPKTDVKKYTAFWAGPFRITKQLSDVMFDIQTEGDWNSRRIEIVASIDRLKRYHVDPYQTPQAMGLTAEDLMTDDEFLEQGGENMERLPQFTHEILTQEWVEGEPEEPHGRSPQQHLITPGQLEQLTSQAKVILPRYQAAGTNSKEESEIPGSVPGTPTSMRTEGPQEGEVTNAGGSDQEEPELEEVYEDPDEDWMEMFTPLSPSPAIEPGPSPLRPSQGGPPQESQSWNDELNSPTSTTPAVEPDSSPSLPSEEGPPQGHQSWNADLTPLMPTTPAIPSKSRHDGIRPLEGPQLSPEVESFSHPQEGIRPLEDPPLPPNADSIIHEYLEVVAEEEGTPPRGSADGVGRKPDDQDLRARGTTYPTPGEGSIPSPKRDSPKQEVRPASVPTVERRVTTAIKTPNSPRSVESAPAARGSASQEVTSTWKKMVRRVGKWILPDIPSTSSEGSSKGRVRSLSDFSSHSNEGATSITATPSNRR